jgi:hypothetical protein
MVAANFPHERKVCSHFCLSTEKSVPLQHQNSRKVRRVNVMDVTYSNSVVACARAEASRFAMLTPPYKSIIKQLSLPVRLRNVYERYHWARCVYLQKHQFK